MKYLYQIETNRIIKCFYEVYNSLGYGFLEKVYEASLFEELKINGFYCERQKKIEVYYKEKLVGEYYSDILVNNKIILELKAAESICEEHEYQLINYLKATKIELGLLLNFGKKPEIKRKIFTNDLK
ncbi:MAG: GxxExxY protein [Melioribacteraceae bacterium]|nr:GxxExxY protein [Melioribacteraceae bacterium]